MSDKVYTQIPPPPTPVVEDPHAQLSTSEQEKYQEVLDYFSKDTYILPDVQNDSQLSEEEKFWLSRECLLRYLRASKWKTQTAIQRLESTLKWRRDFGIYDIMTPQHIEPEAVTGKEVVYGYDTGGRPAFYMFPSRQNTDEPTRQIQFAVWMLERCIDLMRPDVETLTLLINYADKAKSPSISTARAVLNILQDHYPERLGKALIIKIPFYINAFFKIIMPFVDPVTREKVKFNPEVTKDGYFTPEMLMNGSWDGACDFEYEHEKYWPALVSLCEERKKAWLQRWRALGGTIGIKEWDYK
ncbi:CRAL-TRIO domain-containing protein, partial [Amanita rubescens]